ncbi:hypothetical protein CSOJ01_12511 [Colletotrichum sojae]|uniref:Uncharacterized protein n=1 Tax=Colletotrichum sojae TaxID=2175907 RepID=A0A8H6IVA4_9PEZI|nr:hypothetical protein CSOJ01_12511 [Colletotrichum sojae]
MRLFEDLPPEFDPSTGWLDEEAPRHPHFNEAAKIDSLVNMIKRPLISCILDGCMIPLARTGSTDLVPPLGDNSTLWKASISLHKYGVSYLGTRSECLSEFLPALEDRPDAFAAIDAFLRRDNNVIRAINYGVHRFITGTTDGVRFDVTHAGRLVPPYAISSIGPFHVAVRPQDIEGESISRLDGISPLWDLHDFAHQTAASLCPALFGCKYLTSLVELPSKLTALTRSPGMEDLAPAIKCSDGLVFSYLLTPLFAREVEQSKAKRHTYTSLVTAMAEQVADYLQARCELEHASTGAWLRMEAPVTPTQLAVLAQNKAAHKLAYHVVAERMLAEAEAETGGETCEEGSSELFRLTLDMLEYTGWNADEGEVPNLWGALAKTKGKEVVSGFLCTVLHVDMDH